MKISTGQKVQGTVNVYPGKQRGSETQKLHATKEPNLDEMGQLHVTEQSPVNYRERKVCII